MQNRHLISGGLLFFYSWDDKLRSDGIGGFGYYFFPIISLIYLIRGSNTLKRGLLFKKGSN